MYRKEIYTLFIFIIISIIFLLFFSFSTSYIYNTYGFESAIYMVVGKAVASGKQMYIDIFDNKGPVLFFIQYLGWTIGRVWGIFFLQVLNLTCILYIIYRSCCLLKFELKYISVILFSVLTLIGFTNIEGNQSEEYSLLFLFIPLFFCIKYIFIDKKFLHYPIYSLIYGACFCFIIFNQLSNAAAIVGIFGAVMLILFIKKEWSNLFRNILFFILGFVIILIPIIFHFYYYGSLSNMLYATFNMKFTEIGTGKLFISNDYFLVKLSPNILLLITSIFLFIKKDINIKGLLISIFIAISTYTAINIRSISFHYATINAIPLVFSLILLTRVIKQKQFGIYQFVKITLCTYSILMIAFYIYQDKVFYSMIKSKTGEVINLDLINNLIKGKDRESVFGYNIPPAWYLYTDIIPSYKFFTNQEDSDIYFETNKYLTEASPTWIIVPCNVIIDNNLPLKDLLKTRYLVEENEGNYIYYRLIDK